MNSRDEPPRFPDQGTSASPSSPLGNSGVVGSSFVPSQPSPSRPSAMKKFFSRTHNVVIVGAIVASVLATCVILGLGARSGWFSGENEGKGKTPNDEPPAPHDFSKIFNREFARSVPDYNLLLQNLKDNGVTDLSQLDQVIDDYSRKFHPSSPYLSRINKS